MAVFQHLKIRERREKKEKRKEKIGKKNDLNEINKKFSSAGNSNITLFYVCRS